MAAREDLGSWLEGAPSGDGDARAAGRHRLGLPATGPGSLARLDRRVGALAVDWLLCVLISTAFFDGDPMVTLGLFAVENLLLVGTLGHTIGHRLLGIRVRRTPPRAAGAPAAGPVGLARAGLRTVLLCLVIPAVVWDGDGRGMHDRAAGTVLVRR